MKKKKIVYFIVYKKDLNFKKIVLTEFGNSK